MNFYSVYLPPEEDVKQLEGVPKLKKSLLKASPIGKINTHLAVRKQASSKKKWRLKKKRETKKEEEIN